MTSDRNSSRTRIGPLSKSAWNDVALLAIVVGVIIAALLFRGARKTERGAPPTRPPPAGSQQAQGGTFALALPGARDDAKKALRNVVISQEMFYAESARYADDLSKLRGLSVSSGTTIRIVSATSAGWAATAESPMLVGGSCVIRIGAVPDSLQPKTKIQHRDGREGEPRCDGDP
jgi:hypothetical protein